ncbi:hypothetical protein AGMMS49546_03310 [Spirochaetia bacterium]|nr:hypothetical protein AGMMS49546_03310 [Spirochaetia bacterium]
MLMEEYYFYKSHQEEIIKDHLREYVAIKGTNILGYYHNMIAAFQDMAEKGQKAGTYAVRMCRPVGEPDMSVTDIDYKVVPAWTH